MTFLLDSTGYVLRVSPCVLIFNTQQSSPCLLLLVRLSVSFSCSRLIQIKLSFMFLSHSPSVVTQTHTHTQIQQTYSAHASATVLSSTCQHRQGQHFYLLNDFPIICVCVGCVCMHVCHTYSEVSERRPLKASAAMSEIWFLLKSLGRRERGGGTLRCECHITCECPRTV